MSADLTVYDSALKSMFSKVIVAELDAELDDLRWINKWLYATARAAQIAWWMAAGAMPWVKR